VKERHNNIKGRPIWTGIVSIFPNGVERDQIANNVLASGIFHDKSLWIFAQKYMMTVAITCDTPLKAPESDNDMALYFAGTISTRYGRIIVSANVTPATTSVNVEDYVTRSLGLQFQKRPNASAPIFGLRCLV
jgi:hypothetical protein